MLKHINPASWLAKASIKSKLKVIIMTISTTSILMAGFSLAMSQGQAIRENMVSELLTITRIIADNSTSAISFNDAEDAKAVLDTLKRKESIVHAAVYDNQGVLLASYVRSASGATTIPENSLEGAGEFRFTDKHLEAQAPVILDGRNIGNVRVRSDLNELNDALQQLFYSMIVILFLAGFFAFLLANAMQKIISQPLLQLANLTRQISHKKDYTLRAEKHSSDELGTLADDFNEMINQIEKRDRALSESEKRFQSLIEQAADAIFVCAPDGGILHANARASSTLGYNNNELMLMSMQDIDVNLANNETFSSDWQALEPDRSFIYYSTHTRKDGGSFPVEIHYGALDLGGKKLILSFVRDISDRKKAEVALKKANDELEDKVELRTRELSDTNEELLLAIEQAENASKVKSEFLANMSHEIRTPMNAVIGFTELLQQSQLDSKQQSYIHSIHLGAKGLMTIIDDVLDLSKLEAGRISLEYEVVELHQFIRGIEQIFSQTIKDKGLDFEVCIEGALPGALIFDQTRVRQVLVNLIGNAIKFTEKGFVNLNILVTGRDRFTLEFAVSDSGIGIREDQQKQVFEQFTQQEGQSTKRYGGTGLGLSICTNLAHIMGGDIKLESKENHGSTFTLRLNNIKASYTDEADSQEQTTDDNLFAPATVLLVDDIDVNRNLVKEQFAESALTFLEAKNGLQAVEASKKHHPDLVLMDIRMPVMNGVEANERIKQDPETQDIPVVALTASIVTSESDAELRSRFDLLVHKPINKADITRAFAQFLPTSHSGVSSTPQSTLEAQAALSPVPNGTDNSALYADVPTPHFQSLLKELQRVRDGAYRKSVASGMINDIEDFARELAPLGLEFEHTPLVKFGEKLTYYANIFDVGKIEILLPTFDKIISDIEAIIKQREKENVE